MLVQSKPFSKLSPFCIPNLNDGSFHDDFAHMATRVLPVNEGLSLLV